MTDKFILLDGAMGSVLQKQHIKYGNNPETLCITSPQLITSIHRSYIDAGAQIIYTNTFGASEYKLRGSGYKPSEIIFAAVKAAKDAAVGRDVKIALDIGPLGALLEPSGTLSLGAAYNMFAEQVICGKNAGADLIVIETMSDLNEARMALLAAKENSSLPVFVTMTFDKDGRTFTGTTPEIMAHTLSGTGADAIGINCSLGPEDMYETVKKICENTALPIIVKPNAGLPDPVTGGYSITAAQFAEQCAKMASLGAVIFGGCCGTSPEYIAELKKQLEKYTPQKHGDVKKSVVCSSGRLVATDGVKIIGERINPTGKKRLKQAIIENDIDYILQQATQQADAGADILDVNLGVPDINEPEMMKTVVSALQATVNLPLQIDSSDPAAIEAALRVYCGKAIVNSVNGEDAVLDKILPIVKKYGAAVVGLTMDSGGIPLMAQQRVEIAEKIIKTAEKYGIDRSDIYIDCLTLTVSAQQKEAMQTLVAMQQVKQKFGVKTVLGVSNISFGLPRREAINAAFLSMAMACGLDLPIMNPNIKSMTDSVRAFNVIANNDENAETYIAYCAENAENTPSAAPKKNTENDIVYAVLHGLEGQAADNAAKMLETQTPLGVINGFLIPALDKVGDSFEKNVIFLPQLMKSAKAAQSAFEVIKEYIKKSGSAEVSRGTIAVATVKGDVHDIGKNIVKTVVENYGFTVIDLGRDVEIQAVVDCVKQNGIRLLGLSALMTTTLKSMEQTIAEVKKAKPDCAVIVGGAVLTEEYAKKIGADFYAKDAKQTADIAKHFFEKN